MNFGTWQSAIYGLAHADELIPLRKQLKEKLFNKSLPKSDYPLKKRYLVFTFVYFCKNKVFNFEIFSTSVF